jgi:hypothetical protein
MLTFVFTCCCPTRASLQWSSFRNKSSITPL